MIATIIPPMTAIGIHSNKSPWHMPELVCNMAYTPIENEIAVDHARSLCRLSTIFQLR